jgi:pilus assembly protein CpaE
MADLSFIIYAEHEEAAGAISQLLTASGHAVVLGTASDESELSDALRLHRPEVLFFDLGHAPDVVLDIMESIPAPRPQLMVSGPENQSEVILRALKQGAREFLPPDLDAQQLAAAVERIALQHSNSAKKERGKVIAVLGAKGGVGATFVACQLAASLQALGGRTAVVDLNTPLGDVALSFDLRPSYTFADIASGSEEVDAAMVERVLQSHGCGVQILAAPSRMEEAELVKESHVQIVLETLREQFDWVIADVSRSWNEGSIRALELADQTVMVALQDVITLNHLRTYRDILVRLGISQRRIRTVINRHSSGASVTDAEVASFLGSAPDAVLCNDYPNALACVNEGRTLGDFAPGSELRQGFHELAKTGHAWVGRELRDEPAPSDSGIGARVRQLMFGRKSHGAA